MNTAIGGRSRAFTQSCPAIDAVPVGAAFPLCGWRAPVHDVLFLLLIAALFGLVALCAKGAEKL